MRVSPLHLSIVALICICTVAGTFKLAMLGTIESSDYEQYVATAQLFSGEGGEVYPQRLLKPLNPLTVAALSFFMEPKTAMLAQAFFFYIVFAILLYSLAYGFFRDHVGAVLVSLLSALSYPVLKYGVELNSETGALSLYVLSLLITLKFVRKPTSTLVALNALVITLGFLWKEYSVVAGISFGLALLFHSELEARTKALYVGLFAIIFSAIHMPWQAFVFVQYGYSYLSWYSSNVAEAVSHNEFTLFNLAKSTAIILGAAWLLVPLGLRKFQDLDAPQRRFLFAAAGTPFIGYAWGYISSRLQYVIAPPLLLIAYLGMRDWKRRYQIVFVVFAAAINLTWLLVSNQYTAWY